jgi:hypothetical protein
METVILPLESVYGLRRRNDVVLRSFDIFGHRTRA